MPTPEGIDLTNLILNEVDSVDTYLKMKARGHIKPDELYLISETMEAGGSTVDQLIVTAEVANDSTLSNVSHSVAEIQEAFEKGKKVSMKVNLAEYSIEAPLLGITDSLVAFSVCFENIIRFIGVKGVPDEWGIFSTNIDIDHHIGDKNNPHGVTAAQIGAVSHGGAQMHGDYILQGTLQVRLDSDNDESVEMEDAHGTTSISGAYLGFRDGETGVSMGYDCVGDEPMLDDDGVNVLYFNGSNNDGPVRLRKVADPAQDNDAANKAYVDNAVANVGSGGSGIFIGPDEPEAGDVWIDTDDEDEGYADNAVANAGFIVTATPQRNENGEIDAYTIDKTYDEIVEAIEAGQRCICRTEDEYGTVRETSQVHHFAEDTYINFYFASEDGGMYISVGSDYVSFNERSFADYSEVNEHIYNKNNPHGVTAEQVGAISNTGGTMKGNLYFQSVNNGSGRVGKSHSDTADYGTIIRDTDKDGKYVSLTVRASNDSISFTDGDANTYPIYHTGNKPTAADIAFLGDNPITSTTDDTTANWTALGTGYAWYNKMEQLTGQPGQYGMLLNIVCASEVFQIWKTHGSGAMYIRSGNYSGWGETFTQVYDSLRKPTAADVGAAPASHNHSASNITSGTLATARGGFGRDMSNIPKGAIIRYSTDNTGFWYSAPANGAFYATGADTVAKFGTLPVAQGGTGNTSVDTTPTSGSTKMVTSGGVYTALTAKAASSHNQAASTITAGTLGGKVNANATAAATLTNAQVRDIVVLASATAGGSTSLPNGTIVFTKG